MDEKRENVGKLIKDLQKRADNPREQMTFFLEHSSEFANYLFDRKKEEHVRSLADDFVEYVDSLVEELEYFILYCQRTLSNDAIQKVIIIPNFQRFPAIQMICKQSSITFSMETALTDCSIAEKELLKEQIAKAESTISDMYLFCSASSIKEIYASVMNKLQTAFPELIINF